MNTPLITYPRISSALGVNLSVKRDDLFSLTGGGNKARKLHYIINDHARKSHDAVVTTGSNQSNHVRATAIVAAKLGWKSISVIHDEQPLPPYDGNLKITHLTSNEVRFVDKQRVSEAMDEAMADLKEEGYNPLYIWGGGHCVEGALAYYEAVKELKGQSEGQPEYIVLASGTGTTQAGIEMGVRSLFPDCDVLGISVARGTTRGKKVILESMQQLKEHLEVAVEVPDDINFDDSFHGGGYGKEYPQLNKTIQWAAQKEGLILDPTYTGKAFRALTKYIETKKIPAGSNVVFWHTGGLLNLMADKIL